jgi:amino acid transporter
MGVSTHGRIQRRKTGLGTFAGVFTPSILTILGLILFRRLGYVVGGAGVAQGLLILGIAHLISVITSTSLSAIATNLKVRGGGDYYLISRSLGVEFGSALGVVLFLAQSISVAFYCIGFAEAVTPMLPAGWELGSGVVAASAAGFLFLFAWLGADWATRMQYVVMAALVAGLASFFVGGIAGFSADTLAANWQHGAPGAPDFWVLFALFFPAVTGFTQGVSMSGDLKDAGKSLPLGTFCAVGVSLIVYLGAAIVFGGNLTDTELVADYDAMNKVAWMPALITAGIVAATLSSALASFLGAPRILQALSLDMVFPLLRPFGKGHGESNNPRAGVLATLAIALVFIAMGGIDVIAPIVAMFFLISYGLLNYATALEAKANSPSFRPRFRWFHYRLSLVGAVACLGVMLMISPIACGVALALVGAIYQYVERLGRPDRWADSRRGAYFQAVRSNLRLMEREPVHPRNWRPHVLVFSDQPDRRANLIRFAGWMEGGSGLTTVVRLVEGQGAKLVNHCREVEAELKEDIQKRGLEAYALAVAAPDLEVALQTVLQSHGLGPIRANTILLNWLENEPADDVDPPDDWDQRLFARHLRIAARMGVNVVIMDASDDEMAALEATESDQRRIDIWWFDEFTGRLTLLLAYLMTRSDDWNGASIRLLVRTERGSAKRVEAQLRERLEEYRIDAEIQTVSDLDRDRLVARSRDAAMVFLPLRLKAFRATDPFGKPVDELLEELPAVALVTAVEDITLDAEPEAGLDPPSDEAPEQGSLPPDDGG